MSTYTTSPWKQQRKRRGRVAGAIGELSFSLEVSHSGGSPSTYVFNLSPSSISLLTMIPLLLPLLLM